MILRPGRHFNVDIRMLYISATLQIKSLKSSLKTRFICMVCATYNAESARLQLMSMRGLCTSPARLVFNGSLKRCTLDVHSRSITLAPLITLTTDTYQSAPQA